MMKNDLCLLILLPANDAARSFCNQRKSSLICRIQTDSTRRQNGLIYTCIKEQQKSEDNIRNNNNNNNNSITIEKKISLMDSLKNLIKQRRVKINNKSRLSPITDSNMFSNKKMDKIT